jgi:zinc transporter ZupT
MDDERALSTNDESSARRNDPDDDSGSIWIELGASNGPLTDNPDAPASAPTRTRRLRKKITSADDITHMHDHDQKRDVAVAALGTFRSSSTGPEEESDDTYASDSKHPNHNTDPGMDALGKYKSTIVAIVSDVNDGSDNGDDDDDDDDNDHSIEEATGSSQDPDLMRMSMITSLSIFIHNWPEGLATFVATLDDPSVGLAIAVAITLHNIPEGVSVALPIFYATGSRWKAFWWAFFSGISEPIGALVGYYLLLSIFSGVTYGIMFGLVSGMMVYISLHELLPTAARYEQDAGVSTKYVTPAMFGGMFVMALSLGMFKL